jgi:hypothetical protein
MWSLAQMIDKKWAPLGKSDDDNEGIGRNEFTTFATALKCTGSIWKYLIETGRWQYRQ